MHAGAGYARTSPLHLWLTLDTVAVRFPEHFDFPQELVRPLQCSIENQPRMMKRGNAKSATLSSCMMQAKVIALSG